MLRIGVGSVAGTWVNTGSTAEAPDTVSSMDSGSGSTETPVRL
jgi:hypothetical protein